VILWIMMLSGYELFRCDRPNSHRCGGVLLYEGRSINKLQNGVILLIFRLWKFWNIHFAVDLILSKSYEFYYDDVTMTSFINVRYRNVAVEIIPQSHIPSVIHLLWAKGLSAKYHPVWDASGIWWQVFYETSNTCLV